MLKPRKPNPPLWLPVCGSLLVGCQHVPLSVQSLGGTISGQVSLPQALVSSNGASLISSNGASLISSSGANLISTNGAAYRLASLITSPSVTVTVPDAQISVVDGTGTRLLGTSTATTDAQGNFQLTGIPDNHAYFLMAVLPGGQGLATAYYDLTGAGGQVQIDLAHSLVASKLMYEASASDPLKAADLVNPTLAAQLVSQVNSNLAALQNVSIDLQTLAGPGNALDQMARQVPAIGSDENQLLGSMIPSSNAPTTYASYDFESSFSPWSTSGVVGGLALSSVQVHGGSQALAFTCTGLTEAGSNNGQLFLPGSALLGLNGGATVSAYVYAPTNFPTTATLAPYAIDANGAWALGTATPLTAGWNSITLVLPAGIATPLGQLGFALDNSSTSPWSGTLYLDDVTITR